MFNRLPQHFPVRGWRPVAVPRRRMRRSRLPVSFVAVGLQAVVVLPAIRFLLAVAGVLDQIIRWSVEERE